MRKKLRTQVAENVGPAVEIVASDDDPSLTSDEPSRTSKAIRYGAPALVGVLAIGGVMFATSGDDGSLRTGDTEMVEVPTPLSTTTTIARPGDDVIFGSAQVSDTPAPTTTATSTTTTSTTTTSTTTTTVAPTTTAPPATIPDTLPEQPAAPIAPPPDPRGAEDQIQLGGISIPKLGVDAPLLEGIRLTTLDNGPGHWPGTAMPGDVGNVVVAGHRTSHGGVFRNIDQLVAGDVVNFTVGGQVVEYTVTGTQIVNPDAIWIVDPTDTPTATLFACHPPGSVRQRIVVNLELA